MALAENDGENKRDESRNNVPVLDGQHSWVDNIKPTDTRDIRTISRALTLYKIDSNLRDKIINKLDEILTKGDYRNSLTAARHLIAADKQNLNILSTVANAQHRMREESGDLVEKIAEIETNGALRQDLKDALKILLMAKHQIVQGGIVSDSQCIDSPVEAPATSQVIEGAVQKSEEGAGRGSPEADQGLQEDQEDS